MKTTHPLSRACHIGYALLICLCCYSTAAISQVPTISVRFANPTYDCLTEQYCLDVEFLSNTEGVELFGMNIRFFYRDTVLELDSLTDFQGGYSPVSPDPPTIVTGPGGFLNFPDSADFVNGAFQLTNPNLTPIILSTVTWTKIFKACFSVEDPDAPFLCPSIVWDLREDPTQGGFLGGDDGVVITIVDQSVMTLQSLPANENVVQFNWVYNMTDPEHFGMPVPTVCTSLNCAPEIICAANTTVECSSSIDPINTGSATATDICAGDPTFTHTDSIILGNCPNNFIIKRTWIATNACNLSDTCIQFINIVDTTVPFIMCPANTTVQCASLVLPPSPGSVISSDNCAGLTTVTFVGDALTNQICANRYTVNRTYRATDACGNSATCTHTITVFDTTPPALTCPINMTVQCASLIPPAIPGSLVQTDNCGGASTVTVASEVISNQVCANQFLFTRTYQAIDQCGNTSTCSQTITVFDNIPPSISCPVSVTVQCASDVPPVNTPNATATDNCGAIAAVGWLNDVIVNQTCANRYTVLRTYLASDLCGNTATCIQTISVNDTTPPTINCPANTSVSCASLVPAFNNGAPTASDNCSGTVAISFIGDITVNPTCANRFNILRTYQAMDVCGNTATCTQTILVNDVIPPTITCPQNVSFSCTSMVPLASTTIPTATDNCQGGVMVTPLNDLIVNQTCVNRYTLLRSYRAIDFCGNSASCIQTILVNDQIPPSLTCPQNVTVMCANMVPAANPASIVATDNCGGTSTVTFDGDFLSNQTCANRYTITRVYRATDLCGNTATCTQTILVNDQTPPAITCPANLTFSCASEVPVPSTTSVITTDNCGAIASVLFDPDQITNQTCANRYTITRTYRVFDVCGNSASCSQTILVNDRTPPIITCPINMTVTCANEVPPSGTDLPTATDNCTGAVSVTFLNDRIINQTCASRFILLRTYQAADICGNTATCIKTITVNDQTPPFLMCPQNVSVTCASMIPVADPGTVTTTDNCGGIFINHVNDITVNQTCANRLTILRTYNAIDLCGNSASCIQTIIVNDQVPPTINCPQNLTVMCVNMVPVPNPASVTTSDNCSGTSTVIFENDALSNQICANRYTITRTYRATDACGNSATCTQTILVNDQTPPSITCPDNITVMCASMVPAATPASVLSTDNCGGTSTVVFVNDLISNQTCTNRYTISRIYQASDICGNTTTCIQIIEVNDQTVPALTCPPNMTVTAQGSTLPIATGIATATDNCTVVSSPSFSDVTIEGNCDDSYNILRTWFVTDECNNSATCIQTIQVAGGCIVDLTLSKDLDPGQTIVKGGENVNFTITVTNQGEITISSLTITDYIPLGFSLNHPDWTAGTAGSTGQSASRVLTSVPGQLGADGLIPGESVSVEINLLADANITSGIYILAEISQIIDDSGTDVSSDDVDSDADDNDVNDPPGEDDRDPALICVVDPMIVGPEFVCPGDTVIYGLESYISANTYIFGLDLGGGSIFASTDSTVTVVWQVLPGGPFIVTVTEVVGMGCAAIDTLDVMILGADPIACIDHINLSIDNECGTIVTSGMILVGEQAGDNNYTVIIKDQFGNIVPNATLTYEHVGQTFTVMVLSECSGNSCWAYLTVEDKFAPIINCICPEDSGDRRCLITCRQIEQILAGDIPESLRPDVLDNCGANTLEIINIDLDFDYCTNGTVRVIWKATDGSGNSSTCLQVFTIVPLTLATLTFPPDYEGVCKGNTDPSVTGYPKVDGIDLDLPAGVCNLSVTYKDVVIQLCGGGTKILRTWTVRDWCTSQVSVFGQTIWLRDQQGPVLTCTGDITVNTDVWSCYATVVVPRPLAIDSCSKITTYQFISIDGTVTTAGNNAIISGLVEGTHPVRWVVSDECGNANTCAFTITVEDHVAPVVGCQGHTVISLTSERPNGITLVPASVFNDQSFDNCGPVTFRARRMTSCIDFDWTTGGACVDEIPGGMPAVDGNDRGTERRTCVPFGCCDVNSGPIMIELEVSDASGNVNYCMVEVVVQDKLVPKIDCPPNIVVSCEYLLTEVEEGLFSDIDGNNDGSVDEDPLSALFGNVYDAFDHVPADRKNIIINDPNNTTLHQPHTWGLDGWASDNCELELSVEVVVIDDCSGASFPIQAPQGARKLIQRRFRAYDGVTVGSCTQLIWVVDFNPFFITDETCLNANPNDGVIWPCEVLLNTCPQDLSGTGEPILFDDGCSIVGVSFEDHRYNFADSACYKVLREWQVIDWCQFNPLTGAGMWTYTQTIRVMDGINPDFVNCPAAPVKLCTDNPGIRIPANNQIFLGENNPNASSCSVHVTLSQRVHEDCSEQIFYNVKLYLNNGPSFIQIVPETATTLNANHEADISFNTEQSTFQSIREDGLPYNSPLCNDYHRVVWSVTDGCGNSSSCDYLFRLEDCKDPTPVLINGLSTAIMSGQGTVTITAANFNASSNDDCTAGNELLFSFSGTSYQPTKTYTCANVPPIGIPFNVTVWAADEGADQNCNGQIEWSERNKSFATASLVITDPTHACGQLSSMLTGEILTGHEEAVEKVIVNLTSPEQVFPTYTTSGDGKFVFPDLPIGLDYTITPARNDDYKNGVSTLDLVGIQKHLLGIDGFTSPYQYIAADANNSRNVSALDLIDLRKLILGITTVLPNSDSWRFIDQTTVFPDPANPWLFNENLFIQQWTGQSSTHDFIAVKIGDINNSVKANALQLTPRERRRILDITAETKDVAKTGEVIEVKMILPEIISGFQWTMETDGMEYVGVNSGDIQIDDSNVGVLGNGITTISWNGDVLSAGINKDKVTIIMRWKITTAGKIKNRIRLTSLVTPAESYTPEGEILDVKLSYANSDFAPDFNLYQNKPNPWNGQTTIGFDLPEDGQARLTVYDVTGQTVATFEKEFKAGYNTVVLTEKEVHSNGVLYYRLESGGNSASKKMVLIR